MKPDLCGGGLEEGEDEEICIWTSVGWCQLFPWRTIACWWQDSLGGSSVPALGFRANTASKLKVHFVQEPKFLLGT